MFTVHVTPKGSSVRRFLGSFSNLDFARGFAEKQLSAFQGAVAEVINEHDGGFPASTIYIGKAVHHS